MLADRDYLSGDSAIHTLESLLPADVIVFNFPGYPWLPTRRSSASGTTYAYEAIALAQIDAETANSAEAIMVDRAFAFTCVFTHEAGAFAEPQLAPAGITSRSRS